MLFFLIFIFVKDLSFGGVGDNFFVVFVVVNMWWGSVVVVVDMGMDIIEGGLVFSFDIYLCNFL